MLLGQKRQYLFSEEREGMEASLISQKHEKTVVLGAGALTQHDATNLNAARSLRKDPQLRLVHPSRGCIT